MTLIEATVCNQGTHPGAYSGTYDGSYNCSDDGSFHVLYYSTVVTWFISKDGHSRCQ